MKKNSYMNNKNILSEGFFQNLMKFLKGESDPRIKKLKTSKKIKDGLKDINKGVSDFERMMNQELKSIPMDLRKKRGLDKPVKIDRYKLSDLLPS